MSNFATVSLRIFAPAVSSVLVSAAAAALAATNPVPRAPGPQSSARADLVLLVVVDQLRGDALSRFEARFGEGGFRYFLEQGTVFPSCHYRHATTFTAAGHATLVTGGHAPEHGIAGNDWIDRATGRPVYCVEDPRHRLHGEPTPEHAGTSPHNLLGTTIGDELVLASARRSRVFAVSIKDRGAILPGGHLGKAFWYSRASGRFVTSTYYYPDGPPDWVETWQDAHPLAGDAGRVWDLLQDPGAYLHAGQDDQPWELGDGSLGRTFPHRLPEERGDLFKVLRATPFGDERTVDFAVELLEREQLGRRGATDFLAVSLSATDYVGHAFGPESLEAEDQLLRLDENLAALLAAVDRAVGLERTVAVLSSDHGCDRTPESRHALTCAGLGAEDGWVPRQEGEVFLWRKREDGGVELCCGTGRFDMADAIRTINRRYATALDVDLALVRPGFHPPWVALHEQNVAAVGLELDEVAATVARELEAMPGIARAIPRHELLHGTLPRDELSAKVERSFHPERSGHVYVVAEPTWFLHGLVHDDAAMHGSPWAYDTHVPLLFAGPGIPRRVVARTVHPDAVAPTLAAYLGIGPPSGAVGEVLAEVVEGVLQGK